MNDRDTAPDVLDLAPPRDSGAPDGPLVPSRTDPAGAGWSAERRAERQAEIAALHAALAAYRAGAPYDAALYAGAEAHALLAGDAPIARLRALRARLEACPAVTPARATGVRA